MSKSPFHCYEWEADSLWEALRLMREGVERELGGERAVQDVLIENHIPHRVWAVRVYVSADTSW